MAEPVQSENPSPQRSGADRSNPRIAESLRQYWRFNLILMSVLLVLWAAAGLLCGILFADYLNTIQIGGFPLGFWFAQQGSIAIFVVLIFLYALLMNRLDTKHHAELEAIKQEDLDRDSGGATPAHLVSDTDDTDEQSDS